MIISKILQQLLYKELPNELGEVEVNVGDSKTCAVQYLSLQNQEKFGNRRMKVRYYSVTQIIYYTKGAEGGDGD